LSNGKGAQSNSENGNDDRNRNNDKNRKTNRNWHVMGSILSLLRAGTGAFLGSEARSNVAEEFHCAFEALAFRSVVAHERITAWDDELLEQ
jgi:hypothetical protein